MEGSDPGLCVTANVPESIVKFGLRCKQELMSQDLPRQLAKQENIRLEGLGGTEAGVIGALAALGLAATHNDGRIVKFGTWPDDLSGPHSIETLLAREVSVRNIETEEPIFAGTVDVGKHLRPNYRNGRVVLFVKPMESPAEANPADWEAVRLR